MPQVTVHTAKTQLSRLIEAALNGEEVIIARGSTPVVRLVPVIPQRFKFGVLSADLGLGPDFLEPMAPDELAEWEGPA